MKKAILFFSFVFGLTNAQNKNADYIEKNVESCRININDSISIYKIHENLYGNIIDLIIKTENIIIKECPNESISKELVAKINNSQNPLIEINKYPIQGIGMMDFKNSIPNKISAIKKVKYIILIVELYSFSYSTVGSGYINLCFKVDKSGKMIEKKMIESKSSIKTNKLTKIF